MLSVFNGLRDITTGTIMLRMLLSFVCGGAIGMERSIKNRPAGFRTHILISIGATTAAITGHYLYLVLHMPTDTTRLPAQVVTGLGFIGAGTIIVTGRRSVKGLTTAAGLWATGIVGLSIGAGYYEGGIVATILILFAETVMSKIRIRRVERFRCVVNYTDKASLDKVMRYCKDQNISIRALQIEGVTDDDGKSVYTAVLSLQSARDIRNKDLETKLESVDGILSAFVN